MDMYTLGGQEAYKKPQHEAMYIVPVDNGWLVTGNLRVVSGDDVGYDEFKNFCRVVEFNGSKGVEELLKAVAATFGLLSNGEEQLTVKYKAR